MANPCHRIWIIDMHFRCKNISMLSIYGVCHSTHWQPLRFLLKIGNCNYLNTNIKLRLIRDNVLSLLHFLRAPELINSCLHRITGVFWPEAITNKELGWHTHKILEDMIHFWKIVSWCRCVWHCPYFLPFSTWMNKVHRNLRLTVEVEDNGELPFLDFRIIRKEKGNSCGICTHVASGTR